MKTPLLRKFLLIAYLCIQTTNGNCQNNMHWGFGPQLSIGTNSSFGEKTWLLNYFIKKNVDLSTAIGYSTYQGFCSGLSINYSPAYGEKNLNAILSLNYTTFFKHSFSEGPTDNNFAHYKVGGCNYLVPGIGLRKDIINPWKSKGFLSIRLLGTYRFTNKEAIVEYIIGSKSIEYESTINNAIQKNLGFNITVIGVFDFKKNE